MSPLSGMTDGFPPLFVVPAIVVVLVGIAVTVLIVRFFLRLARSQARGESLEPERDDPSIASRAVRRNLGMS